MLKYCLSQLSYLCGNIGPFLDINFWIMYLILGVYSLFIAIYKKYYICYFWKLLIHFLSFFLPLVNSSYLNQQNLDLEIIINY